MKLTYLALATLVFTGVACKNKSKSGTKTGGDLLGSDAEIKLEQTEIKCKVKGADGVDKTYKLSDFKVVQEPDSFEVTFNLSEDSIVNTAADVGTDVLKSINPTLGKAAEGAADGQLTKAKKYSVLKEEMPSEAFNGVAAILEGGYRVRSDETGKFVEYLLIARTSSEADTKFQSCDGGAAADAAVPAE